MRALGQDPLEMGINFWAVPLRRAAQIFGTTQNKSLQFRAIMQEIGVRDRGFEEVLRLQSPIPFLSSRVFAAFPAASRP